MGKVSKIESAWESVLFFGKLLQNALKSSAKQKQSKLQVDSIILKIELLTWVACENIFVGVLSEFSM